jgi:hypothetical protein
VSLRGTIATWRPAARVRVPIARFVTNYHSDFILDSNQDEYALEVGFPVVRPALYAYRGAPL